MPQKKPLNDAELEAFEDSLDFDALLLKSAGEMAARKTAVVYGPAIEARRKLGLTQAGFAQVLDVSPRTLQQWEQGRRQPSGAARKLVEIALKAPHAFIEAGILRRDGIKGVEVVTPEGASGEPVTGRRRNLRAAAGTKPPGKAIRSTTVPR